MLLPVVALLVSQTSVSGEEDLFELENELVATASRVAEPLRLAPASITVVPRSEIESFGFASTGDALTGVRGMSLTNDELWPSVGVRGFNRFADYGNRVQVQLDGHVLNDDWIFSSYVSDDQLTDLSMIDSIEVLRGPGSALYGTGALLGVINLSTSKEPPPYRVRAGVSVVETLTGRLHVDGGAPLHLPVVGDGGVSVAAAASGHVPLAYHSDAYVGTPGFEDGTAAGVDRLGTATAMAKVFASDVTLQGFWHHRDRGYATGVYDTAFGDVRNTVGEDRGFVELRYEPVVGVVHVASRVFVDVYGYDALYTAEGDADAVTLERYFSTWGGVEVRGTAELLPGLRLIAGAQYELHPQAHWFQTDFLDDDFAFHAVGVYATADWRPVDWLLVGAGVRGDGWLYLSPTTVEDGDDALLFALNPRAHVIWMPDDDDTVKLLAGRAYRAPSLYELEYSPTEFNFTDGAPGLLSESVTTVELEVARRLPFDSVVIGAVYGSLIESLIEDDFTADSAVVEGYSNEGAAVVSAGAEVEVRRNLGEIATGSAFYAFQRVRTGDLVDGEPEPNSPEHLAGVKLLVPLSGPRLGLAQRLVVDVGRLDRNGDGVDPAVVWDVTLSGRAPEVAALTWSVGVRNVLDAAYRHPVDNAIRDASLLQPGRNLRLELSFAF